MLDVVIVGLMFATIAFAIKLMFTPEPSLIDDSIVLHTDHELLNNEFVIYDAKEDVLFTMNLEEIVEHPELMDIYLHDDSFKVLGEL